VFGGRARHLIAGHVGAELLEEQCS
jgi:hypothetical protein